jgi:hypothetical protein
MATEAEVVRKVCLKLSSSFTLQIACTVTFTRIK